MFIRPGVGEALLPDAPFDVDQPLLDVDSQLTLASAIADRAVVIDIQSEGLRVAQGGRTWWDTRPMTDQREHVPDDVEIFTLAIRYAVGTGLASVHPTQPYLLTFERQA